MFTEDALYYRSLGWCIYPAQSVDLVSGVCTCGRADCSSAGKHPVGNWSDFRGKLPTLDQTEMWFSLLTCNIGMMTGEISKVVVVDLDGIEGLRTAEKLKNKGLLQETLTARTGGGGLHYFYSCAKPFPSKVRVLDGVDIRGDGGFIILPPSVHKSGRTYEWLDIRPMANFDPTPFVQNSIIPSNGNSQPNWYDEIIEGVSQGSRSMSAARLAGRYFNLGMSESEVNLILNAWNSFNDPPIIDHELQRTIRTIKKKREETPSSSIHMVSQIRKLLEGDY